MNVNNLAKEMLKFELGICDSLNDVKTEIIQADCYYLVASKDMDKDKWIQQYFAAFIDDNKSLVVFLNFAEASLFAKNCGCVLDEGQVMVKKVAKESFMKIIAEYTEAGLIDKIKIYSYVPLSINLLPRDFIGDNQTVKEAFAGVEAVKQALGTYETNARRQIDAGGKYENIHTLISSLMQQNCIEYEDMDKALEIPSGYTRNFCTKLNGSYPSIELMRKYLAYFGLEEYLYIYKSNCLELIKYLKEHKTIDKYSLKPVSGSSERFLLQHIEQGHDEQGVFIYKLTLTSKVREITMIVSNPLNCVIGREYRIVGLEKVEVEKHENDIHELPNEETMQALIQSLENKNKKKPKAQKTAPSYEEERKNRIIRFFRENGLDGRDANERYSTLETETDILDSFYKYIRTKQFGKIEVLGYTARKLIKELHYDPYEAYSILVQLRNKPKDTKQMLKYRETDPQYQKQPKKQEEN